MNLKNLSVKEYCETQSIPTLKKPVNAYWALPCGEIMAFFYFLERNFNYKCRNGIHYLTLGPVQISGFVVRNEVGEPFLNCTANVPKSILSDILYTILNEYRETM